MSENKLADQGGVFVETGKGLAVEWAGFARVNTISPGYIATEISNFVPQETKTIWREKIPLQLVPSSLSPLPPPFFILVLTGTAVRDWRMS